MNIAKSKYFIVLFLLLYSLIEVQAQDLFQKKHIITGFEYSYDSALQDSNLYLVGTAKGKYFPNLLVPFIGKFDLEGNPVWGKVIEVSNGGRFFSTAINAAGNVLALGEGTFLELNNQKHYFIVEVDPTGNVVNHKVYHAWDDIFTFRKIKRDNIGRVLICGGVDFYPYVDYHSFVAIVYPSLSIASTTAIYDMIDIKDMAFDSQNNIYAAGLGYDHLDDEYTYPVVKLNSNLNLQWFRFLHGAGVNMVSVKAMGAAANGSSMAVVNLSGPNEMIVGFDSLGSIIWSFQGLKTTVKVMRSVDDSGYLLLSSSGITSFIDDQGNLLWRNKTAPTGATITNFLQLPNKQILHTGYVLGTHLYLGKYDSVGLGSCNQSNAPITYSPISISRSPWGSITQFVGFGTYDLLWDSTVTMTTQTICSGFVNVDEVEQDAGIKVYPNPSSENVWIRLPEQFFDGNILIRDMNGRAVKAIFNSNNNSEIQIDISDLKSGIYLVEYESGKGSVMRQKLVVI